MGRAEMLRHLSVYSRFCPQHPRIYHPVYSPGILWFYWVRLCEITQGPKPLSTIFFHVLNK